MEYNDSKGVIILFISSFVGDNYDLSNGLFCLHVSGFEIFVKLKKKYYKSQKEF